MLRHRPLRPVSGIGPEPPPRLKEGETETVIVTLSKATPYYEASRLEDDLNRAGIRTKWWVVNKSLTKVETESTLLRAKAQNESVWIRKVSNHTDGSAAVIA